VTRALSFLVNCCDDNQHFIRTGDDRSIGRHSATNHRGQLAGAVVALFYHRRGAIDHHGVVAPPWGEQKAITGWCVAKVLFVLSRWCVCHMESSTTSLCPACTCCSSSTHFSTSTTSAGAPGTIQWKLLRSRKKYTNYIYLKIGRIFQILFTWYINNYFVTL
jgi:hypothetical protein